jgi:RNA polymerase sigma factor (sigma-70 family)
VRITGAFYGDKVDADKVAECLRDAAAGDSAAWDALVEQYGGLVWSVARAHRLSTPDAADVSQTTWLRLVEHLGSIKQPERLGAWLATTARREALAVIRRKGRQIPMEDTAELAQAIFDEPAADGPLLQAEEHSVLAIALGRLAERCQRLLRLLMVDPPPHYEDVAAALGIPIGSIGPTRARCLERLKHEVKSGEL